MATKHPLDKRLQMLLTMYREAVAENRQQASYETDHVMKSWLDGRASAYANAAAWLQRVIDA